MGPSRPDHHQISHPGSQDKVNRLLFPKEQKSMLRASRPWADLSGLEGREENVLVRLLVPGLAL